MAQTGKQARKPKKAFTGLERKLIRNLRSALASIVKMDQRETARAAKLGISPIMFRNLGGVSLQTQIEALRTRCTDAMTAKIGGGGVVPPPVGPQ